MSPKINRPYVFKIASAFCHDLPRVRFKELSLTANSDAGNATQRKRWKNGRKKRIYFMYFNFTLLGQNERKLNKLIVK